MKKLIMKTIKLYKKTMAPLWGTSTLGVLNSTCRFYPTCSDYAADAVQKYGVFIGTTKAIVRILRCNPFSKLKTDESA